jgi:hypothetical protein
MIFLSLRTVEHDSAGRYEEFVWAVVILFERSLGIATL